MLLVRNKPVRQVAGLLETLSVLSLKLLVRNPGAMRLFPGIMYRNYLYLARRGSWISRDINEIVPTAAGVRVTLEILSGEGILTPHDELVYLALLARHLEAKRIFEIGTFRGRTALNFALNTPDDAVIHTMDLPPGGDRDAKLAADRSIVARSLTGIDYAGKDVAGKIRQIYGDSATFDFSPYYGTMDLVFVDGAHHYDAVVSDTEQALKMTRPGGFIVWHDFGNYGDYNDVTRAVLDRIPGDQVIQIGSSQLAVHTRS
jgi:predicted O-methyltransferase YrrM